MRIILLFTCLTIVASCAKKTEEIKDKKTFEESILVSEKDTSTGGLLVGNIKGQFKSTDRWGATNPSTEVYSKGCKVQGESEQSATVNLALPRTYTEAFEQYSSDAKISLTLNSKITSQNKSGFKIISTYKDSSSLETVKPGAKFEETCQIKRKSGMESLECKYDSIALGLRDVLTDIQKCVASGENEKLISTSTFGNFIFADKKVVKAYFKNETITSTNIKCTGIPEFKGDFTHTVITTNDVLTRNVVTCGGDTIYVYEKAVDEKGNVVKETSYELLGFEK
ncbi:MAG: hypothetical protein SGI74_10185 [Oligoflexia bacterium]|nr:hypothetical protein [Oligoflexia bacterium]